MGLFSDDSASRHQEEIQDLQDTVDSLRRSNIKRDEALREQQKNQERFRQELLKREEAKARQEEAMRQELKKLLTDLENTKNEIKKLKKIDGRAEEVKKEKEKLRKLQEETRKKEEAEKRRNDEEAALQQEFELVKVRITDYKNSIKKIVESDDNVALYSVLKDIDESKALYLQVTSSNCEKFDSSTILAIYNSINLLYEDIADYLLSLNKIGESVNLYKKIVDFSNNKINAKLQFKYGKALYLLGDYVQCINYLKQYKDTESSGKINNEVYTLLLKSFFKTEDSENIKIELNNITRIFQADKSIIWDYLDLLQSYMEYKKNEETAILYLSHLVLYSHDILRIEESVNKYIITPNYKKFYLGLVAIKKSEFEVAIDFLPDNFILGRLYKYRAMYHLKTTEVILNEVRDLLKQISFILPGRETDKRKKIIDCSNSLVAPDITNGNYFLSFVNDLFLIQINYYYAKSNSNDLIKVLLEYFDFLIKNYSKPGRSHIKDLVFSINFLEKQNINDSVKIKELLLRYLTLEQYLDILDTKNCITSNLSDIYNITDEKLNVFSSPFYYALRGYNKSSGEEVVVVESYRENLNEEKREKRSFAIKQETKLFLKYKNITPVQMFSIDDEVTQIVYNKFTKSLLDENKCSGKLNSENISQKLVYINQVIKIFEILENEKIVVSSMPIDHFAIDSENNIILRDIYFDASFRSESQSSIGSSRTSTQNRYKAPEDRNDRDFKTNYYLLGLIIYEILYGDYIFSGVEDFATIKRLHNGDIVSKTDVYSLKKRWAYSKNEDGMTKVAKINLQDDGIPNEYKDVLFSLLAERSNRPNNLNDVKRVFSKSIEVKKATSLTVSKAEFKNRMMQTIITKVEYQDEFIKNVMLNDNIINSNIRLIENCDIGFKAIIYTESGIFYISIISKNICFEFATALAKKVFNNIFKDVDELLTNLLTKVKSEKSEFLYTLRQIIYELETDRDLTSTDIYYVNNEEPQINLKNNITKLEFIKLIFDFYKEK